MIDLIASRPRAIDQQGELLLHALLTDELTERARPESIVEVPVLWQHHLGVDQALVRIHGLLEVPAQPDAADAVAVAVCHLTRARLRRVAARAEMR